MKTLDLALKEEKVWLVAEAGATHTGLQSAKSLVDIACEAGFDAIKFQIVESDKCPHPDEIFNGYRCIDIWKQRELQPEEWRELKDYCNKNDIYSFTTITDAKQLGWFPSDMYKIRARDINNHNLIRQIYNACRWLQIDIKYPDTIWPILVSLPDLSKEKNIIVNHCPSGYPAKPEDEHLGCISEYKENQIITAYSSHTKSITNDLLALALGVDILEKPIRQWQSLSIAPEVKYALDNIEAKEYVQAIRNAERALGR